MSKYWENNYYWNEKDDIWLSENDSWNPLDDNLECEYSDIELLEMEKIQADIHAWAFFDYQYTEDEKNYYLDGIVVPKDFYDKSYYEYDFDVIVCDCEVTPLPVLYCPYCLVYRVDKKYAWRPCFEEIKEDKNFDEKLDFKQLTDRHYGQVVEINGLTFYASSLKNDRKPEDFIPDFGLYLDWSWKPYWRNEHIYWEDYDIPHDSDVALKQIISAIELTQQGLKVEIGCIGGHGRTGTALAVIGVILGLKPQESIDFIKKTYCHHAIETKQQEWWVHKIYAQLNNEPIPIFVDTPIPIFNKIEMRKYDFDF